MVVLVERDMVRNRGSVVRRPGAPLAEYAVETAVSRRGAVRADSRRVEGELIVADQHILGLPPAVVVVRLGHHAGWVARVRRRYFRGDQGALARRGVGWRATVPLGVLPQDHAAPVVDERVARDRETVPVRPRDPRVS